MSRACITIEGFPEVMEHFLSPFSLQSRDFCICSHQSKPGGVLTNWTDVSDGSAFLGWKDNCLILALWRANLSLPFLSCLQRWGRCFRQKTLYCYPGGWGLPSSRKTGWFKCEETQGAPPREMVFPPQPLWYKSKTLLTSFSRQLKSLADNSPTWGSWDSFLRA